MAQPLSATIRALPGRPRKHPLGWEHSVKRICINKATYSKWQGVKKDKNLKNDDAVAMYLLSLYERVQTTPALKGQLCSLALGTELLDGMFTNNHGNDCLLRCAPSLLLGLDLQQTSPLPGNVIETSPLLSSTPRRYSEYNRYVLLHYYSVCYAII